MVDNLMNLWSPNRNADYFYIDGQIQEYFRIGGVSVFLHKYLGVYDQGNTGDFTQPGTSKSPYKGIQQIQDLFFKENRDRSYYPYTYELKGMYNIQEIEYNLHQFGGFLENDTFFIEFHLNDCLEKIGRKLMAGDVLEMLHMRDDALLNPDSPAMNKFYVIDDVSRSASGWSPVWRPHVIRCKIKPLTNTQEFNDILNQPASSQVGGADGVLGNGLTLADILSDTTMLTAVNTAIDAQANADVPYRGYTVEHIWVSHEGICHLPWAHMGIGVPPNGAKLVGKGKEFPKVACEGDWFLNTGYFDPILWQYSNGAWRKREVDFRSKWEAANRILESFINNKNITAFPDGTVVPEKQAISKIVKPRADF